MRRAAGLLAVTFSVASLALVPVVIAGCGHEGTYVHPVGTCVARADGYKISVKVWCDVGRTDQAGKGILIRACGEVNR